jgi:hypothetical protein
MDDTPGGGLTMVISLPATGPLQAPGGPVAGAATDRPDDRWPPGATGAAGSPASGAAK